MSPDARWAREALGRVLERVAVTREAVGDRFPLYADPVDGGWTTTRRGSWTGGFWAGLLWLRARATGDAGDRRAAAGCTDALAGWVEADTVTRGLILWYGTALDERASAAARLRGRAGGALLAAFDPGLGLVPWGAALGGDRLLARTDGLPGTGRLLACAGAAGVRAAAAHLDRHLGLCLPGDAMERMCPAWRFRPGGGWEPCEEPRPGWSRGEAWLLLALADALLVPAYGGEEVPARVAAAAVRLADGLLAGSLVPPADAGRDGGPPDTSAAAIGAVALLKLARARPGSPLPGAAGYERRAVDVLRRLADHHLSRPEHGRQGGGRPAGMLLDGCYDADRGLAVRHELVWGDFFLALGLAALTGLVDPVSV
ncbi:sugar ABC transporter permease [Streptomyces sp. NPDC047097]|uniref:sugar ABC transporter permease n=1 Tax=Streptomyces sp. NPDC047097 TaxID=3155260 RepID=UPI0033E8F359